MSDDRNINYFWGNQVEEGTREDKNQLVTQYLKWSEIAGRHETEEETSRQTWTRYDSAGGAARTNYTSRENDRQKVLSTVQGRWLIPSLRFCISDCHSFEEINVMYNMWCVYLTVLTVRQTNAFRWHHELQIICQQTRRTAVGNKHSAGSRGL
jgi:hypothetical protein